MKEKEVNRFFTHNFFNASVFGTPRYGTGLFIKFKSADVYMFLSSSITVFTQCFGNHPFCADLDLDLAKKKVDADPGRGFEGIVSREQAHEKIFSMSRFEVLRMTRWNLNSILRIFSSLNIYI